MKPKVKYSVKHKTALVLNYNTKFTNQLKYFHCDITVVTCI